LFSIVPAGLVHSWEIIVEVGVAAGASDVRQHTPTARSPVRARRFTDRNFATPFVHGGDRVLPATSPAPLAQNLTAFILGLRRARAASVP
jgi:hypothetical protein